MNRAERRARTANIMRKRDRQWSDYFRGSDYAETPRTPGRARTMSHFDCGRTQCFVCNQETRPTTPAYEDDLDPGPSLLDLMSEYLDDLGNGWDVDQDWQDYQENQYGRAEDLDWFYYQEDQNQ